MAVRHFALGLERQTHEPSRSAAARRAIAVWQDHSRRDLLAASRIDGPPAAARLAVVAVPTHEPMGAFTNLVRPLSGTAEQGRSRARRAATRTIRTSRLGASCDQVESAAGELSLTRGGVRFDSISRSLRSTSS